MAEVIDMHAAVAAKNPKDSKPSQATAKMVNGLIKQAQQATKHMRQEWPDTGRSDAG